MKPKGAGAMSKNKKVKCVHDWIIIMQGWPGYIHPPCREISHCRKCGTVRKGVLHRNNWIYRYYYTEAVSPRAHESPCPLCGKEADDA